MLARLFMLPTIGPTKRARGDGAQLDSLQNSRCSTLAVRNIQFTDITNENLSVKTQNATGSHPALQNQPTKNLQHYAVQTLNHTGFVAFASLRARHRDYSANVAELSYNTAAGWRYLENT